MKKKLSEVGPEVLEHIRENYPRLRRPDDPETFDEYKERVAANPIDVPAPHVCHQEQTNGQRNHIDGMDDPERIERQTKYAHFRQARHHD
jgi:hypothetical protein